MTRPTIAKLLEQNDGKLPYYAFPGGYPIVYLDGNDWALCPKCANDALDELFSDDQPQDWFIHYEGDSIFCEECNAEIESAYGIPE